MAALETGAGEAPLSPSQSDAMLLLTLALLAPPRATLDIRDEAACVQSEGLAEQVSHLLGYEPFAGPPDFHFEVRLSGSETGLGTLILLRDLEGEIVGEREIQTHAPDCQALMDAVALGLAIAIDPVRAASPPPPPEPRHRQIWIGARAGVGASPSLSAGPVLGFEAGRGWWLAGVEAHYAPASTLAHEQGEVSADQLSFTGAGCGRWSVLRGCALALAGLQTSSGAGFDQTNDFAAPMLAAGARLGVNLRLGEAWAGGLDADVLAPLTRTRITVDGTTAWSTSAVTAGLNLRFGYDF